MIIPEKKIWCGGQIISTHCVNCGIIILWDKTLCALAKTDDAWSPEP
jgi:hypothetical protein